MREYLEKGQQEARACEGETIEEPANIITTLIKCISKIDGRPGKMQDSKPPTRAMLQKIISQGYDE